jgi:hypothetical protein
MKISENSQQQLQQIKNETQPVNLIDRRTRNNQYFNISPLNTTASEVILSLWKIFFLSRLSKHQSVSSVCSCNYKLNVTVSYDKGKSRHLADALSRAYINDQPHPDKRSIEKVNSLMFIQVSDQRVKSIA